MDKKGIPNVKNISSDINNNYDYQNKSRTELISNQSKGIQCHGREGFGHIRA